MIEIKKIDFFECFICGEQLKGKKLSQHITKYHKVSELESLYFGIKSGKVLLESCKYCGNQVNIEHLKKITKSFAVYYSRYNEIVCSTSCSISLLNKERHKNKEFSKKLSLSGNKKRKGKKIEEWMGIEKAKKYKKTISNRVSGENNPNYGGKYSKFEKTHNDRIGLTLEEYFGNEKAKIMKQKISNANKGKNNPMYGKPSPQGSGNGWSGWYKGWHFRSLLELSYVINILDRFNIKWESAESEVYKIQYKDFEGNIRNYFPDFIAADKYLVECKPRSLVGSKITIAKAKAAIKFCNKHGLKYKIVTPLKLSFKEIFELRNTDKIKFTKQYEKKYSEKKSAFILQA